MKLQHFSSVITLKICLHFDLSINSALFPCVPHTHIHTHGYLQQCRRVAALSTEVVGEDHQKATETREQSWGVLLIPRLL